MKTSTKTNSPRDGQRRTLRPASALLNTLAASAVACLSACAAIGQSGSEGQGGAGQGGAPPDNPGGLTVPCPCGTEGTFLRALVLARDGSEVSLRVITVIHGETTLRAGDELSLASYGGDLPCYRGTANVVAGDEALAVLRVSATCDASDCLNSPSTSLRMTPWTEDLLMAETAQGRLTVPASEIEQLWNDPSECVDRYGDWAQLPGAFEGGVIP
jgi:hypothetical protein